MSVSTIRVTDRKWEDALSTSGRSWYLRDFTQAGSGSVTRDIGIVYDKPGLYEARLYINGYSDGTGEASTHGIAFAHRVDEAGDIFAIYEDGAYAGGVNSVNITVSVSLVVVAGVPTLQLSTSISNGSTWNWGVFLQTTKKIGVSTRPFTRDIPGGAYLPSAGAVVIFGGERPFLGSLADTWYYTGVWARKLMATSPVPQAPAGMSYDSTNSRIVLLSTDGTTWRFDGSTWLNLAPVTTPTARTLASMADYGTGVLMFGGFAGGALQETWLFGTNWVNQSPGTSPSARYEHALFRVANGDVRLFGGNGGNSQLWKFSSGNWAQLTYTGAPAGRSLSPIAKNAGTGYIMFGGKDSTGRPLGDTWKYDDTASAPGVFSLLSPATAPPPRFGHLLVYDTATNKTVMSGGTVEAENDYDINDTWEWDNTDWTNTVAAKEITPYARFFSAADNDVLFGGTDSAFVNRWNDTFTRTASPGVWNLQNPTTRPVARGRHALAFDSTINRHFLFGGLDGSDTVLGDTWRWRSGANTWTDVTPGTGPVARSRHAMVYHAATSRVILFGGLDGASTSLGDTWAWDSVGNTWSSLAPTGSPAARSHHAMAYNSTTNRTILFGGNTGAGADTRQQDTYSFDGTNWSLQAPATSPGNREKHAMAYDVTNNRVVLFGGLSIDDNNLNDTWVFSAGNWTQLNVGGPDVSVGSAMWWSVQDSCIYLFGGFAGDAKEGLWRLDPTQWTRVS